MNLNLLILLILCNLYFICLGGKAMKIEERVKINILVVVVGDVRWGVYR